ncbi:MAG TPA: hypothetical protein VGB44_07460 [Flavobacterium sp.]|jgi:predicted PurR-regulated permease PerM
MKNSIIVFLLALTSLISMPTYAATSNELITEHTKNHPESPERVRQLLIRLDEIKAMDKSEMTKTEKKELRKEVREIKSELRTTSNGVYLSVGAIIIIILLLILLV